MSCQRPPVSPHRGHSGTAGSLRDVLVGIHAEWRNLKGKLAGARSMMCDWFTATGPVV